MTDQSTLDAEDVADLAEIFEYLDDLRDDGSINMFAAPGYVARDFECDTAQARANVKAWMDTFSKDEPAETRARKALAKERSYFDDE